MITKKLTKLEIIKKHYSSHIYFLCFPLNMTLQIRQSSWAELHIILRKYFRFRISKRTKVLATENIQRVRVSLSAWVWWKLVLLHTDVKFDNKACNARPDDFWLWVVMMISKLLQVSTYYNINTVEPLLSNPLGRVTIRSDNRKVG